MCGSFLYFGARHPQAGDSTHRNVLITADGSNLKNDSLKMKDHYVYNPAVCSEADEQRERVLFGFD